MIESSVWIKGKLPVDLTFLDPAKKYLLIQLVRMLTPEF
jgi:hypothetical protein